jgi:tight adherence protein C
LRATTRRLTHRIGTSLRVPVEGETTDRLRWAEAGITPADFGAARLLVAAGGCAVGSVVGAALTGLAGVVAGGALGVLGGYACPGWWLGGQVEKRWRTIDGELLYFVDLLALAAEAGLSIEMAIGMVSEELPGIVAGGLAQAMRERKLGQWTEHAWSDLGDRFGHRDLRLVLDALARAGRFGSRTAQTLRDIATTIRHQRGELAAQHASRAGTAIVLPLALFILPSIIVLLAYPAFASLRPAFGTG